MCSLYNSTMGVLGRRHHHRISAAVTAFALIFLASSSAAASSPTTTTLSPTRLQLGRRLLSIGEVEMRQGKLEDETKNSSGSESLMERVMMMMMMKNQRRGLLGGRLGSSPPTCRSRCGRCTPCRAVHVPIQPGLSIPLEYYPEAWRCKCGSKLFLP